jgi:SAM-dependent methyltransferase
MSRFLLSLRRPMASPLRVARRTRNRLRAAIGRPISKARNRGGSHYCPVCRSSVREFLPFGDPIRQGVLCPVCGSFERHRLDWLLLESRTKLLDGRPKSMLHVAPEPCMRARFRSIKSLDYLSANLGESFNPMVQMDITDIRYPDNTFSMIYCSHVLEHVPEDRAAISELHRVLQPDGDALLQVPIMAERTYEDPTIVDPEERKRHFGQRDHVRRCGPDYVDRMREAGFSAEVLRATDLISEAECDRMGIKPHGLMFLCRKPADG